MKKAILILVLLILSLLYYTDLLTEKETFTFSKEFFSKEGATPAEQAWDLQKVSPIRTKGLEELYQTKLDRGIQNIPILSSFLIREAEQARQKKDFGRALEWANEALRFSPQWPQPHFELARIYWHQNPLQLNKILDEVLKGEIAQFQYFPTSLTLFYNLFYILSNAILIAFMIFGIVIMIKYLPLYFFNIRKNLSQEILSLLLNGVKIFFLFLPFFLHLDLLWAILFWSISLWGYVEKRERRLILIFLILLAYVPFFLRSFSTFITSPASEVILKIHQANAENWESTTEDQLKAWLATHPDDPEVLFSLGLMKKREGQYLQSEEYYRKAIQKSPPFSELLSNMGNVYLAQKQIPSAITSYQQAIDLNSNRSAYHYNLYRAYTRETFLSGKVDQPFQQARQLDPQLIDFYLKIESSNMNRLVIDEILKTEQLWKRFLGDFIGKEGYLFLLFKTWFEPLPSRGSLMIPLFFLAFLIGMSQYCRNKRFLTRCPLCNHPTYRFYMGPTDQELYCSNCYRIFIQKKKLPSRVMETQPLQVQQVQQTHQFIGRFLSFFFAGFGYLWGDRPFKGILFLILFFIFILKLVYWKGVVPSSIVQPFSTLWGMIGWGGLLILFYLFSLRQIFRMKTRFKTEKGWREIL